MATTIDPKDEVFLDTSFAVALSAASDALHDRALLLARIAAINLLQSLESDPNVKVMSLSDELYARALALFSSRPDKEWGLIDCVSFVVMSDRGITKALTADEHFEQAGFHALLREDN